MRIRTNKKRRRWCNSRDTDVFHIFAELAHAFQAVTYSGRWSPIVRLHVSHIHDLLLATISPPPFSMQIRQKPFYSYTVICTHPRSSNRHWEEWPPLHPWVRSRNRSWFVAWPSPPTTFASRLRPSLWWPDLSRWRIEKDGHDRATRRTFVRSRLAFRCVFSIVVDGFRRLGLDRFMFYVKKDFANLEHTMVDKWCSLPIVKSK